MQFLYETDKLAIKYEYEEAYLINKNNDDVLFQDRFIGEPQCGLISPKNNWAIVAGDHITIWKEDGLKKINGEKIGWVHDLRQKNEDTVEILIDPWSEKASILTLSLDDLTLNKVKNFPNYQNKPSTEKVEW